MSVSAGVYNYAHFDFSLEDGGAYERWLDEAPGLGELAPDFELPDVDGARHRLADLRGRPVVIEFGSYTCPVFCAQIRAMEALAREHPKVTFLVVYTREAHPGEQTPAHASQDSKLAAAARLTAEEPIDRTVLVDDVEGTVHRSYGAVWDAVFVVDADGTVVLRRAWNAPDEVSATLDALASGRAPVPRESVEMAPFASPGGFGHGLLRGGEQALIDFYQSAPPPVQDRLRSSESPDVRRIIEAM
jgi:peroxiredoxin